MKNPNILPQKIMDFLVFCTGFMLVFAANAKVGVGAPVIIPPFPLSSTTTVWYVVIGIEYMIGLPLALGFGSREFRRFAALLFAVFAIYQTINIINGKSSCDCFGYSMPSLIVLVIDLLSLTVLVFSSVAGRENSKGSNTRFRISAGVIAVLVSLIAFVFPVSPKVLLPGVVENASEAKRSIDLEVFIKEKTELHFRELLSEPNVFDGQTGDILVVRANCDTCHDFIDNWQLGSATNKNMNNSMLLVITSGDSDAKKHFPKWQGIITSFKSEYDIMVRTPTVLSVRNGKIVPKSLN